MTTLQKYSFFKRWAWNRKYFLLLFLSFFIFVTRFINSNNIYPEVNNYLLVVYFFFAAIFFGFDLLTEYDKYQKVLRGQSIKTLTALEAALLETTELAPASEEVSAVIEPEPTYFDAAEVEAFFELWTYQMANPLLSAKDEVEKLSNKTVKKTLTKDLVEIEQHAELVLHYITLASFEERVALQTVDVYDLVRQTIDKYSLFFIQRQIKLSLGELNYTFVTEPQWFAVMLEQVVANVVKYSRDGQLHIAVEGDWLAISDKRGEIASSDLGRVFEGAHQVKGRAENETISLGLYLAKEIAKKLSVPIQLREQTATGTKILIGLNQPR